MAISGTNVYLLFTSFVVLCVIFSLFSVLPSFTFCLCATVHQQTVMSDMLLGN